MRKAEIEHDRQYVQRYPWHWGIGQGSIPRGPHNEVIGGGHLMTDVVRNGMPVPVRTLVRSSIEDR